MKAQLSAFLSVLGVMSSPLLATELPTDRPEYWQALARADLDAAREAIRAVHPGAIDRLNPSFAAWIDAGYEESLALLPQVISYDSLLAVTRHYVGGFKTDYHFMVSDDIRGPEVLSITPGWAVSYVGQQWVVGTISTDTSRPLPQVGWHWLGCDGRGPEQATVPNLRYANHRAGNRTEEAAAMLPILPLAGLQLRHCQFADGEGRQIDLKVEYRSESTATLWPWLAALPDNGARAEQVNDYARDDKLLWVRAGNFQPDAEEMQSLERMLKSLRLERGVRILVFDVRGNRGGNSAIGDRIFAAATGGLEYDRKGMQELPETYALWRVSQVALDNALAFAQRARAVYGKRSGEAQEAQQRALQFREALRKGKPWVRQDGGVLLTRAELQRRGARLKHFDGQMVLLTDHDCVSACLDFADQVKTVPGSLHVGETTSADALYIDGGARVTLPSGNPLVIPLKVWRNRLRGNNEPYVPDVPLALETLDEPELRRQVLAAALACAQKSGCAGGESVHSTSAAQSPKGSR